MLCILRILAWPLSSTDRHQFAWPAHLCMADYAGKLVPGGYTASHCGFTPQYTEPSSALPRSTPRSLVVLGFPATSSGNQSRWSRRNRANLSHQLRCGEPLMFEKVEVNSCRYAPGISLPERRITRRAGSGRIRVEFY